MYKVMDISIYLSIYIYIYMYIYICIFLGPPTVRKVDKDQQFTASQNAVLK